MKAGSAPAGLLASGWIEAALFAVALSVLNVSYGVGHEAGCHPVAFLLYAMPIAGATLVVLTGPGPEWRAIVRHRLSWAIGGCIIGMEAAYYLLLKFVTPADGSLLVRLNLPVAMVMGLLLLGRRPNALGAFGGLIVLAAIVLYLPAIETPAPGTGTALAVLCAAIMSARAFAAEFHPWNRREATIPERMRTTGLVLLTTSLAGAAGLGALMAANGLYPRPELAWLPARSDLLHPPTMVLGIFIGGLVLTAMQYLGFSVVSKLGAETFVATTALIPLVTLLFQELAVRTGLLSPIVIDWRILPPMLAVLVGVLIVIIGGRRQESKAAAS